MAKYSMWIMEYAHVPTQAVSSVLAGQHNKGVRKLAFSYMVLKGEGHTIMIDVGLNPHQDDYTKKLMARDDVQYWQGSRHVLAKVGVTPEEVDTVFLTHAHYDHMGALMDFPNAKFYIQKHELEQWHWATGLPERYQSITMALNPCDLQNARSLIESGRMILLDGPVDNILPGISIRPAYDGHTYASQMIIIDNDGEKWVNGGDLAYVRENITGINNDGIYVPVGLAVGSSYNIMKTFDEMLDVVGGKADHVIIGHEIDNWDLYPSWETADHLHVAELSLAPGDTSKRV